MVLNKVTTSSNKRASHNEKVVGVMKGMIVIFKILLTRIIAQFKRSVKKDSPFKLTDKIECELGYVNEIVN